MVKNRDDFSSKTKDILAKRAGFQCSKPSCPKGTVGPGSDPDGTASIGVAAHICGAAPGSARYDPNQTTEERTSLSNGIWLCQDHAKLIDSDVETYSVDVLRSWKKEHEEKIRRERDEPQRAIAEVSGVHTAKGKGNVTGLDVRGPAIIKPGTISRAEGEGNVTGTRIGPD